MVIAVGTDIVEIRRIADSMQSLGQRFVQRVLCPPEIEAFELRSRNAAFLAKRFAAKEATAKALGTGIGRGVSFQDIEIYNTPNGAPCIRLSGGAANRMREIGATRIQLSLSDEREYAVAFVVLTE